MFKNYIKTIFRTLRKYAVYSVINVVGLAIGLTGSLVIFNVLQYETGFDSFHSDADQIYRVVQNNHTADGVQHWNTTAYTLAPELREDFPGIEMAQTAGPLQRVISSKEADVVRRFEVKNVLFADAEYLQMFDFKEAFADEKYYWLQGDKESAFNLKNSVILTRNMAELYFPNAFKNGESLLGKSLLLNNKDELIVSGIVENPPANTNLPFEMLISYEFFKIHNPYHTSNWSGNYQGSTYVKIPSGYAPEDLTAQLPDFKKKYMNPQDIKRIEYDLKPLSELHNDPKYGASVGSYIVSDQMLIGLGVMGAFLLIIACVNYINLSTAQASKRAREVGIRKVLGGSRMTLINQFFMETLVLTSVAAVHSYVLADLVLKELNRVLSLIHLNVRMDNNAPLFFIGVVILISLLASIYPAFSISGYHPIQALKSKVSGNTRKDRVLRNLLVIAQFAIVQLLVVGTFVVRHQMELFKTKDLGFDKEAVVVVNVPDRNPQSISSFRERLLQYPTIEKVSFSSGIPTEPFFQYGTAFRLTHEPDDMNRETEMKVVDLNYLDMYNLEIIAGNWINESNKVGQSFNGFVVNESLVKLLNMEPFEIVGQEIQINEGKATVVGVVKDFNNQALQEGVTPCVLFYWGTGFFSEVGIKMTSMANTSETLAYVEQTWQEVFPDKIYHYQFIDDYLARSYQVEEMISLAFQVATILSIIIGCLGLYGLIAFVTESRTKEIGIRRVLGAGIANIVQGLSRELLFLLSVAIIIGSLSGWYVMNLWLQNFSHKTDIGLGIFVFSTLFTISLALTTISFKTIKAASANPVDSLRYE